MLEPLELYYFVVSRYYLYCSKSIWMGQQAPQTERHILLIANTNLPSTRQYLQQNSSRITSTGKYHCYSFVKYLEINTKVIQLQDEQTLSKVELVIVIGQNRELMFTFAIFHNRHTPPIFAIGNTKDFTSPFVYNFTMENAEDLSQLIFFQQRWENLPCDKLMKISLAVNCKKIAQAACQVQIHRGMTQSILILNLFIQNSCDDEKIKIGQFRGDGLLISTPMGSYCKSLSLNGPVMDRTMENIMITPICPLSMKFRPLCVPPKTVIIIEINEQCRTPTADIYIDENCRNLTLEKGQQLRIRMSKYKNNMISNLIETSEEFLIRSLRNVLGWGESYGHIQHLPKKKESINE